MPEYTFRNLSSYEFEDLVRDLLQAEHRTTYESFSAGRDAGIDLRYSCPSTGASTIVQCKHYEASGFSALRSELKDEELPKIRALNPSRYILATSVPLLVEHKATLLSLLSPYINGTSDIIGHRDINNLLGLHPSVERRHFKLWLGSTTVLDSLLNSATLAKREMHLQRIQDHTKFYVQTSAYNRAVDVLNDAGYCIIAGIPGIGKTTLADMIVADHIARGYEFYLAEGHIDEVSGNAREGTKQLFYYDDFLGQTSLEHKLNKNEDRALLHFIDRVRKSKSLRLLLTTREYILNQAKMTYEVLDRSKVDERRCVIELSNYNRKHKALILYNHLYFSSLPTDFKNSILSDKAYLKIIDHPNYNPRTIEVMTDYAQLLNVPATQYVSEFMRLLTKPSHLWDNAFSNQIRAASQHLLLTLASLPSSVMLDDLRRAWSALFIYRGSEYGFPSDPKEFRGALKELEGNFIKIGKRSKDLIVEFQNPSVRDYVEDVLRTTSHYVEDLCRAACYFDQFVKLWSSVLRTAIKEQGVNACPVQFWSGMYRTIDAPSCELEHSSYWRKELSLEARVGFAFRCFGECKTDVSTDAIRSMLKHLVAVLPNRKGKCDELVQMLRNAKEHAHEFEPLWTEVVEEAKQYLIRHLDDDTDLLQRFDNVLDLEEMFPNVLATEEQEAVKRAFQDKYREEIDVILENSSAFDLDEYAGIVARLGTAYGVRMDDKVQALQDEKQRLEEESEVDRIPDTWSSDEEADRMTDKEIEDLFGGIGE